MPTAVVSCSGGKDSTATLLLALERLPKEKIFPVFADTGNEHDIVYEYLDYLENKLGISIKRCRADFSGWWWKRRDYVRDKWPQKGVPVEVVLKVVEFYEKGPTGNPFLDLCVIKNRFPSRRVQFCTQYLKKFPLQDYILDVVKKHGCVESWQGVRADESPYRSKLPERESGGDPWITYRPILKWNVRQVFEIHRKHGVKPNPLYRMGMGRVGCMPCINASKMEISEIAKRFPEHIDRIDEWEKLVSKASRRGAATFFPSPDGKDGSSNLMYVRDRVEWAKTVHGGRQYDIFKSSDEPEECASSYGLCEGPWQEIPNDVFSGSTATKGGE